MDERPQNVIVSGGIYSVILGSVSTLTPLAFDVPYWLGVRVGSDAEMTEGSAHQCWVCIHLRYGNGPRLLPAV